MADNMMNKMMKKPFRNVPAHSGDRLRESKTGFGKTGAFPFSSFVTWEQFLNLSLKIS